MMIYQKQDKGLFTFYRQQAEFQEKIKEQNEKKRKLKLPIIQDPQSIKQKLSKKEDKLFKSKQLNDSKNKRRIKKQFGDSVIIIDQQSKQSESKTARKRLFQSKTLVIPSFGVLSEQWVQNNKSFVPTTLKQGHYRLPEVVQISTNSIPKRNSHLDLQRYGSSKKYKSKLISAALKSNNSEIIRRIRHSLRLHAHSDKYTQSNSIPELKEKQQNIDKNSKQRSKNHLLFLLKRHQ